MIGHLSKIFFLATCFAPTCAWGISANEILSRSWPVQVVGIADGDTVKVRLEGKGEQIWIRLYGIDAPEKGQPYGRKSRELLSELIAMSEAVAIEPVDFDHYGRLVAIIYNSGSQCLNEMMIEAGLAWVYPHYCNLPFCSAWYSSEDQARLDRLGLWADSHPEPPWAWRKRQSSKNN